MQTSGPEIYAIPQSQNEQLNTLAVRAFSPINLLLFVWSKIIISYNVTETR